MSDLEETLFALTQGQPRGPTLLSWGVHNGIAGAQWIEVHSEGRVTRRHYTPNQTGDTEADPLGVVPQAAVADLADLLLAIGLDDEPPPMPRDPGRVVTIEVSGPGLSWTYTTDHNLIADRVDLIEVRDTFNQIAAQAAPPPAPSLEIQPYPEALLLSPSSTFWLTLILGGAVSCGVVSLILLMTLPRMPRRMDAEGVTLRSGKRHAWDTLQVRQRVAADRPGLVLGLDLITPEGKEIRIAPGGLDKGQQAIEYALDRV